MEVYRTKWANRVVEISADFNEAACNVVGTQGRQVVEFEHKPANAMRCALEEAARAEGLDPDDPEARARIESAVAAMFEVVDVSGESTFEDYSRPGDMPRADGVDGRTTTGGRP